MSNHAHIQFIEYLFFCSLNLQSQIALLSPQVEIYKNQQRLLQLEQKSLNQKMNTVNNKKILRDGV